MQDHHALTTALYIHIPWCRSICTYCDFDRQAHSFDLIPAYLRALVAEMRRQPRVRLHSVFFGGGTPSLLEPSQISALLSASGEHFDWLPDVEVSLEANPGDLDESRLADYLAAGVNRFSVGVQSFDDGLLRILGRRHTGAEAEQAVRVARAAGAGNLSLDLMYGLPGQTPRHWRATLARALALEPDHLSAYLLTIDERVVLGRQVLRGAYSLPVDEVVGEMYDDARVLLADHGYEQYEISNWARPGHVCRHNLTYWRDEPYLGLGAGAASSFAGRRYKNVVSPEAYIRAIESGRIPLMEEETTDPLTAVQDHLALRLRLYEGLDLDRFKHRFGRDLIALGGEELAGLVQDGVLVQAGHRLRISANHLLVSNEVFLRLQGAVERSWDSSASPISEVPHQRPESAASATAERQP